MSDSEDKKGSQALPIVPPEGTSLVIIRNKDGSVREVMGVTFKPACSLVNAGRTVEVTAWRMRN